MSKSAACGRGRAFEISILGLLFNFSLSFLFYHFIHLKSFLILFFFFFLSFTESTVNARKTALENAREKLRGKFFQKKNQKAAKRQAKSFPWSFITARGKEIFRNLCVASLILSTRFVCLDQVFVLGGTNLWYTINLPQNFTFIVDVNIWFSSGEGVDVAVRSFKWEIFSNIHLPVVYMKITQYFEGVFFSKHCVQGNGK